MDLFEAIRQRRSIRQFADQPIETEHLVKILDAARWAPSGGNQQKVVLAKWLATKPKVLLLDEPTRGIDVNAKNEIYKLISELAAAGLAIVMSSSELPEIMTIADRIIVLSEGRQTAELPRATATEESILKAALPRSLSVARRDTN